MLLSMLWTNVSFAADDAANDDNTILYADMSDKVTAGKFCSNSNHFFGFIYKDADGNPITTYNDGTKDYELSVSGDVESETNKVITKRFWKNVQTADENGEEVNTLLWDNVNKTDYYTLNNPTTAADPALRSAKRSVLQMRNSKDGSQTMPDIDIAEYPYINITAKVSGTGTFTGMKVRMNNNLTIVSDTPEVKLDKDGWQTIKVKLTAKSSDITIGNMPVLTLYDAPDDFAMNIAKIYFSKESILPEPSDAPNPSDYPAPTESAKPNDDVIVYADMSDTAVQERFVSSTNHVTAALYKDSDGNYIKEAVVDGKTYRLSVSGDFHADYKTHTYFKLFKTDSEVTYDGGKTLLWDNVNKTDNYLLNNSVANLRSADRHVLSAASSAAITQLMPQVDLNTYPYMSLRIRVSGGSADTKLSAYARNDANKKSDTQIAVLDKDGWQIVSFKLTPSDTSDAVINSPYFKLSGANDDLKINIDKIWFSKAALNSLNLKYIEAERMLDSENSITELSNVFVTNKTYSAVYDFDVSADKSDVEITKNGELLSEGYSVYADGNKVTVKFDDRLDFSAVYRITWKDTIKSVYDAAAEPQALTVKTKKESPLLLSAEVSDSTGKTITNLSDVNANDRLTVTGNVYMPSGSEAVFITAVYDKNTNEMLWAVYDDDGTDGYINKIEYDGGWDGCYINNFLWGSIDNMGVMSPGCLTK